MRLKIELRETTEHMHHCNHVLDFLSKKRTVAKETALTEVVK